MGEMWNVKCGMWNVKCGMWNVRCVMWNVECEILNVNEIFRRVLSLTVQSPEEA